MAETRYRQDQPKSLMDLLTPTSTTSSAPVASAPPSPATTSDDDMRKTILSMLFSEDDSGPAPPPEKPEWQAAIGQGLSALGDAVGAFAAGRSGNPGYLSNAAGQYRARLDQQDEDRRRFAAEVAQKKNRSKREKGAYLLSELDRKQEQALAVSAAKAADEKADRLLKEKIARDAAETAQDQAFQLQKQKEASELDRQENEARFRHESGLKAMEIASRDKDDPKADKALQQFSLGARISNGILRGVAASKEGPEIPPLAQRLAGDPERGIPPQSPEEIRRELEDEMTQEGIFGKPRDLVRDYFNERLIRTWRQVKQAENQPPGQ